MKTQVTKVRFLAIVEMDVRFCPGEEPLAVAQERLDGFRESVQASAIHGITIYRTTVAEAAKEGAINMQNKPVGLMS